MQLIQSAHLELLNHPERIILRPPLSNDTLTNSLGILRSNVNVQTRHVLENSFPHLEWTRKLPFTYVWEELFDWIPQPNVKQDDAEGLDVVLGMVPYDRKALSCWVAVHVVVKILLFPESGEPITLARILEAA